ncbi:hypothetical protein FYL37_14155 [Agathobacter rectalis]|uniref:Uncharacterized protein n=1 Tax=Agathobacter rectalis TaxID=39491 RepID=A0A5S4VF35_9FIRM|nr:hypothetical protein [Agathobacter rectalis]TYL56115.1 hypothetical protein FYL37_14155 [Agathobacter rectalis]
MINEICHLSSKVEIMVSICLIAHYRDFCDFSYFFLLFSSFLGGFGMLFGEFLRFQLLFPALFKLFGWVWGAVLEILGITAPQDPLAMLPTYGYCTL